MGLCRLIEQSSEYPSSPALLGVELCEIDPTFLDTLECNVLQHLSKALQRDDHDRIRQVIEGYQQVNRGDEFAATLLERI